MSTQPQLLRINNKIPVYNDNSITVYYKQNFIQTFYAPPTFHIKFQNLNLSLSLL